MEKEALLRVPEVAWRSGSEMLIFLALISEYFITFPFRNRVIVSWRSLITIHPLVDLNIFFANLYNEPKDEVNVAVRSRFQNDGR